MVGILRSEGDFKPVETLEAMVKKGTAEACSAKVRVGSAIPDTVEEAKKMGIDDIDPLEAIDYYRTPRGQKPTGIGGPYRKEYLKRPSNSISELLDLLL